MSDTRWIDWESREDVRGDNIFTSVSCPDEAATPPSSAAMRFLQTICQIESQDTNNSKVTDGRVYMTKSPESMSMMIDDRGEMDVEIHLDPN